jgi:hypothetical protein
MQEITVITKASSCNNDFLNKPFKWFGWNPEAVPL